MSTSYGTSYSAVSMSIPCYLTVRSYLSRGSCPTAKGIFPATPQSGERHYCSRSHQWDLPTNSCPPQSWGGAGFIVVADALRRAEGRPTAPSAPRKIVTLKHRAVRSFVRGREATSGGARAGRRGLRTTDDDGGDGAAHAAFQHGTASAIAVSARVE